MRTRTKLIATAVAAVIVATGTAAWAAWTGQVRVKSDLINVGVGPELQELEINEVIVLFKTEAGVLYPRQTAGVRMRVNNRGALPQKITGIVSEGAVSVVPECKEQLRFFGKVASPESPVPVPASLITGSSITGPTYISIPDAISVTDEGYKDCQGHSFRTVWKVTSEPL
jgi:hypothetical protein